ncbi:hypothetical protein [Rhizobium rhizogenes]|uniref:Uncharacterized protein n=1 Tax=Rhizobium rhizogenes (strain K84 / ATCC BAA-868) TaxID=311403 RepID=B9JCF0_RHIR8|nr:hypothetical protein [Rhizobium rhizogenes]ACM28061.1 hypothetical protein Arad_4331 [Rhizobium rhizogenes K84]NTG87856.1 hypothetical protein [Rhizobium rhizogenes]
MAYFHLKLVLSRSGFPHDATGEEMAAMQQHAARVFEADGAFDMRVIDIANADNLDHSPAICRRKFYLTHKTKNQDLNNGH